MDLKKRRATRWAFTVCNYQEVEPPEGLLHAAEYLVYSEEVGPITGEPHIQGYVVFYTRKRLSQLVKFVNQTQWHGAHFSEAYATTSENVAYCTKGIDPDLKEYSYVDKADYTYEFGTKPDQDEELNDDSQRKPSVDWAKVAELAAEGGYKAVLPVYPQVAVCQNAHLERIFALAQRGKPQPPVPRLKRPCGVWLFGAPGTGKSTVAYDIDENYYLRKASESFWSGYTNEDVIIYDDVDHETVEVKGFTEEIKHSADALPFAAGEKYQVKRKVRPKLCLVTSQWSIRDLWAQRTADRIAIERRFMQIRVERHGKERTYTVKDIPDDEGMESQREFKSKEDVIAFIKERVCVCEEQSVKKTRVE